MDEDLEVTTTDGEAAAAAPEGSVTLPNATLTEQVKAELTQKYGDRGRIIGFKQVPLRKEEDPNHQANDVRDERPRLAVTFENGEGKRFTVQIRAPRPGTGDFITYEGEQEEKPTGTRAARTPEQQAVDAAAASKATEDERERAYHRSLGHGNLTHKEYEDKLDKDQTAANARLTQARADRNQERITAAQEAANQLARDRLQHDKDKENRPDVKVETVEGGDGQSYTRHIATRKDGSAPTVTILGPDGKPVKAIPGKGAPAEPAGAPRPQLTLGTITRDLQSYAEFLSTKVAKGELKPQEADELLKKRRELATSAVQEQTALVNAQRGIFSDELTQRGQDVDETASRRKDAQSATNSALAQYQGLLGKVSGDAYAGVVGAEIEAAHANAGRWGGLTEHPQITLPPFLQQVRSATIDPTREQVDQQAAQVTGETKSTIDSLLATPPAGAAAAAPEATTATPSPAPDPAAAAAGAAAAGAMPPPGDGQIRIRSLGPGPDGRGTQAGYETNVSQGDLDGMTPEERARWEIVAPAAAPASTPVNPPTGQPGNDPTRPVGMGEPPTMARMPLGGTPPPPFIDQARFGQQYSPDRVLSMLVGDPDLDTEAVLEGYKQVFGTKPKVQQAA
jgi:hypothetical protein